MAYALRFHGSPARPSRLSADIDPEDEILALDNPTDATRSIPADHSVITAPVFTSDALRAVGEESLPQRALYGRVVSQHAAGFPEYVENAKIYVNTNAPFSGLVCGVQGSGKSHTTSVLLESCLIRDRRIGTLPAPLSTLVFHFDTAAGGGAVQPCEAAYLAAMDEARGGMASPPAVTVLVMPTYLNAMRKVYASLPNVHVAPLHFAPTDISGERLLAMMKVDTDQQMPLYMEAIMVILRSMEHFDYTVFKEKLAAQKFSSTQKSMLNLRLSLLDSCLQNGTYDNRASSHFKPGQLTIIDLSSPFMEASAACSFFDIILGLFVEARTTSPAKLVVLDEAHKYLAETGSSSRLTESLLTVIRQQRHLNMRVVVSTQEPTVVPSKFIDLCSFIIAHRFSSPQWLKHLAQHVSAAGSLGDEWFSKVVSLRTGEAMMFAPAGLGVKSNSLASQWEDEHTSMAPQSVAALGQGYLVVRSRPRVTRDGGQSLLAVVNEHASSRLRPVSTGTNSDSGVSDVGSRATSPGEASSSVGLSNRDQAPAPPVISIPIATQTPPPPAAAAPAPPAPVNPAPVPTHVVPPPAPTNAPRAVPLPYAGLVTYLRQQRRAGFPWVSFSDVGKHRSEHPASYRTGKLVKFLEEAQAAGVVRLDNAHSINARVELAAAFY